MIAHMSIKRVFGQFLRAWYVDKYGPGRGELAIESTLLLD